MTGTSPGAGTRRIEPSRAAEPSPPVAAGAAWLPAWVRLLPLLVLYAGVVLAMASDALVADEGRYLAGAANILKGHLASEETQYLWNGPGYPLYLVPFVALGVPLLWAKLGNAVLLFLAMIRFHGALRLVGFGEKGLLATYALGVFLLLHQSLIDMLMTEGLSAYLVCGAAYHFLRSVREPATATRQAVLAGLHLGYLALTKVFFGYALTAGLLASGAWWAWRRRHGDGRAALAARQGALACALALAVCLPYLAYTFALTGRAFFWSNSGGAQLYSMTLDDGELFGDWLNFDALLLHAPASEEQARFHRALAGMDPVTRDRALMAAAVRNIEAHPWIYVRNWRSNVNRMVFGFPVARYPGAETVATGNRSFVYALPFYVLLLAAWPAWKRRSLVAPEVQACFGFAVLSLAGLSLLSAFPRMVFPLLPLLALWTAAVAKAGGAGRPA